MSTQIANRFLRAPDCSTDEEREFAYVDVTATSDTADRARDWLIANAEEQLDVEPSFSRLRPEHIELRALGLSMPWPGLLPEVWDVERLVRGGLCEAWWRFDVSMAVESLPDLDWERASDERNAARNAEQKRRAVAWRGPWWWRLQCWLSQRLLTIGGALEPADKSSAMWEENGRIHIEDVRRPA